MPLLATSVVRNSRILPGIYFIFQKMSYIKLESVSIPNLDLGKKIVKVFMKLDKI